MNEQSMRFRLGLFVLAALMLLAVLIILFGGFPTLFKATSRYTVVFTDAPGVSPGTPVRRSGVRIGEVKSVDLDDATGKVRITLLLDKPHPLYQSDQATLVHGLLGGDTSIDFVPQRVRGEQVEPVPVPENTEFVGTTQANVATLLNQTSEMVPTTQETLNQIRTTLQRLEKMTPLVEDTLREYRDLGKAAREAVPEVRRTNDEIRELARTARETVPELRRTNDEIQVTARNWGKLGERLDVLVQTNQEKLVKTLENLNDTVVRVGSVFNEENQRHLNATLKNVRAGSENLESMSKNTDAFIKESRQTLRRVNDSVGQAEQVLTNLQQATKPLAERSGTVMKNLEESTDQFNRVLADLREILRAIGQGDGSLRRFVTDADLYNNLNTAACLVTRVLPRLDYILKDVQVFADKIARHPEALGIGGVVNPSSGLKEAPSNGMHWPRH